MQSINAIYDGTNFKPTQPIPIEGNYKVLITFLEPIEKETRKHIPLAQRLKDWDGLPAEPEVIDWGGSVGEEEW
jgi:predicted DNA-binding antitoxin AbrB/MazE fold protein